MKKKQKTFKEIVINALVNYKDMMMNPDDWTLEFVICHVILWSVLPELPFYIIFGHNYNIVGLFLTYMISLMPLTITLLIILGRKN